MWDRPHARLSGPRVVFDMPGSTRSIPTPIPPAQTGSTTASISAYYANPPGTTGTTAMDQRQASNTCLSTQTEVDMNARMNILSIQCRFGFICFMSCPPSNRRNASLFVNHAARSSCILVKRPTDKIESCSSRTLKRRCNVYVFQAHASQSD